MVSLARRVLMLAGVMAVVSGCKNTPAPKLYAVTDRSLPAGAEWNGVYYDRVFGYIHIAKEGGKIKGGWKRETSGKCGKLEGTATGGVLRFEWTEYADNLLPGSTRSGRGVLEYIRPERDPSMPADTVIVDQLKGDMGIGEDEVDFANGIEASRQLNREPDLAGVQCGNTGNVSGSDWDSDNKEKGKKPEAPEAPPPP
jgi:hypothetical protein